MRKKPIFICLAVSSLILSFLTVYLTMFANVNGIEVFLNYRSSRSTPARTPSGIENIPTATMGGELPIDTSSVAPTNSIPVTSTPENTAEETSTDSTDHLSTVTPDGTSSDTPEDTSTETPANTELSG